MNEDRPSGPYVAVEYGTSGGSVYKTGPRGGRYFINRYTWLATARRVADFLNGLSELEAR